MKKLFLKLKFIATRWLLKEHLDILKKDIAQQLIKRDNRISELENYERLVKATTNIGINLQQPEYGRSWIAVCIRGEKQSWVQFFDGSDQTIREIQNNFRDLEKSRIIVDGRPGLRAKDFWL